MRRARDALTPPFLCNTRETMHNRSQVTLTSSSLAKARVWMAGFLCALSLGSSVLAAGEVDWNVVLGPAQGEWPEPLGALKWRGDLAEAQEEARRTGRPLLVTARCLPCKQCATIDKQVLEGGPLLTPLLTRFVTVRLTDAFQIDLARLPAAGFQDLDVSWWVYFLSPEGELYGIFGGKDEVSDSTRVSVDAMANTLKRVLDHHSDPRRESWRLDGPAAAEDADFTNARDLDGYVSWKKKTPEAESQGCLHCHQVVEVMRQPAIDAGSFDKENDVDVWPFPENIGVTVDRDDGLLVTEVIEGGAAERLGLRVGDRLAAAGGRRLFGQADLRGVLHREARPSGKIDLRWLRDGQVLSGDLELAAGWRETVLDWRMSISQGNIGANPGFFPLKASRRKAVDGGMAISPFFGKDSAKSPAFRAGLRPSHVILAVNGESPNLDGRPFLVWFRLTMPRGEEVALTVLEGDRQREIRYTP